jgi:hypothetical protein
MDRQLWAIRPLTDTASNIEPVSNVRLEDDGYRLGRRESAMSTHVIINYFDEIDMSNWAFGPIYCP